MSPQEIVQSIIASSERVAIYAAVFGALAAIIGGVLAGGVPLVVSWCRRPKLGIEFDDKEPGFILEREFIQSGSRFTDST
jgi:hypothetical protein